MVCVKDGVLQSCVCEKWCGERWCVTKWCVKNGVWQSCVWKMVCQRWWVTKWCVKDGAWKMVGDKVVCERGCVKDGATPATQNDRGCEIAPRLPRETKVDVTKSHACHAELARRHGRHARLYRAQGRHPVPWVPVRRLPRKTTVDVRLSHACHVKSRWMSPSATPASQKCRVCEVIVRQCMLSLCGNDRGCEIVPHLPREIKVDVTKCHACHAASWMWDCAKVGDKAVCERWCVTKLCVKDGVWQSCMWKMVCDKVVCERWCVTKLCVKDGVWQEGGGGGGGGRHPGYRIKNKNPTQSCGE